MIHVENLVKTFKISKRTHGVWGAVRGLFHRTYHSVQALDRISFHIAPGELVGYIGPNGAGKSTTIKILSGILVPDSGTCVVNGRIPWKKRIEYVSRIGVVFGHRTQLWWDLPVIESFDLLADIYRVPARAYKQRIDGLIAFLGLESLLDVPVRQLSLGQRMRCDLAASLLHNPDILFLDEPTIGLDAVAKLAVRDFIQRINAEQKITIILTTHDMDDIETLCNRVMVIGDGHILSDGPLSELRRKINNRRILIVDLEQKGLLVTDPDVILEKQEGYRYHLSFDPSIVSPAQLIARISAAYPVRDLFVENPPIEQIVARFYTQWEKRT